MGTEAAAGAVVGAPAGAAAAGAEAGAGVAAGAPAPESDFLQAEPAGRSNKRHTARTVECVISSSSVSHLRPFLALIGSSTALESVSEALRDSACSLELLLILPLPSKRQRVTPVP